MSSYADSDEESVFINALTPYSRDPFPCIQKSSDRAEYASELTLASIFKARSLCAERDILKRLGMLRTPDQVKRLSDLNAEITTFETLIHELELEQMRSLTASTPHSRY